MSRITGMKETKPNSAYGVPGRPIRLMASVARHGAFVLILGVAAALLSWNVTQPWVGYYSGSGADFAVMARNYLRYGYVATRLGSVTNPGLAKSEEFRYYTDHPILLPV